MSLYDQIKKQAGLVLGPEAGAGADADSEGAPAAPPGLLGGVVEMLAHHGGVGEVARTLSGRGLGDLVSSWIGPGANRPISPEQVQHGLGPETIDRLAAKLGVPPGPAAALLSQYLPGIIDKLTPQGTVEGGPAGPGPEAENSEG